MKISAFFMHSYDIIELGDNMGLFSKKIKDCQVLERYKIDIDGLLLNKNEDIKLIGENDKYVFFNYTDSGNHYILRQNKLKRKEVVSFGSISYYDVFCIWDKYLVMAMSGDSELNIWDSFIFIDTETGSRDSMKLRSEYGNMVFINGYGRKYNQDTIRNMYTRGDTLIIEFGRKKCTEKDADKIPYNEDMDYTLYLEIVDNEISIHRSYEEKKEGTKIEVTAKEYGAILAGVILISGDTFPKLCELISIKYNYINHLHFFEYLVYISQKILEKEYPNELVKYIINCSIDTIIDSVNFIKEDLTDSVKELLKDHYNLIEKNENNIFDSDGLDNLVKLFEEDLGLEHDVMIGQYILGEFTSFMIYHAKDIVNKKITIKNQ